MTPTALGVHRAEYANPERPNRELAPHTLDDLTAAALTDWLDYRRHRWPNTANPHLLISKGSALRLGPVSHPWLNRIMREMPATLERLRIDRYLDEAIATGADPLHLAEVFGICETTAIRYGDAARQLLNTRVEHHIDAADDPGPEAYPSTN